MINWVVEAIWQTIFGFGYFIGIYTCDRNLKAFDGDYSDEVRITLKKTGPVSPLNRKVLLSTILMTLPLWLHNLLYQTEIYSYLIYLSLGCFFSPLILPNKLSPDYDDLKNQQMFIRKWVVSKVDNWLKMLVLFAVCFFLSLVPFIRHFGIKIAELMLPVIPNKLGTKNFEELISGAVLAIAITHVIRLSMLIVNGLLWTFLYCFSVAFLWVDFQWVVNENFVSQSLIRMSTMTFVIKTILDFHQDILTCYIEKNKQP